MRSSPMSLEKDVLQLASIFALLIIFLIFGGFYLSRGAHVRGVILLGSLVPLFILMVMKGKSGRKKDLNLSRLMKKSKKNSRSQM